MGLLSLNSSSKAFASSFLQWPQSLNRSIKFSEIHPIVFESDDWGLCGEGRDQQVQSDLVSKGYVDIDSNFLAPMYKNTLESESDLDNLSNSLAKFKDRLGRSPIFTANMVVSNPDFERIKQNRFSQYFAIPISKGFPTGWHDWATTVRGWKKAINRKVWLPEYHGFSHFNYRNWIRGLGKGDQRLMDFFNRSMVTYSVRFRVLSEYGVHIGNRWDFQSFGEQYSDICAGFDIFNSLFGRFPRTTIPPNNVWNPDTYRAFLKSKVRFIQSEKESLKSNLGARNTNISLIPDVFNSILLRFSSLCKQYRNVHLEYNDENESAAVVSSTNCFVSGVPAIVGTHRVNYVSGVDPNLPRKNLKRLENYLHSVLENENVVFLSDNELFQLRSFGVSREEFGDEILLRNFRQSPVAFKLKTNKYEVQDLTNLSKIQIDSISDDYIRLTVPSRRTISLVSRV